MLGHFVINERRYNIAQAILEALWEAGFLATMGAGAIAVHVPSEQKEVADGVCRKFNLELVPLEETPDDQKEVSRKAPRIKRRSW